MVKLNIMDVKKKNESEKCLFIFHFDACKCHAMGMMLACTGFERKAIPHEEIVLKA